MKISLSPQVSNKVLAVSKSSELLTINSQTLDFSTVPESGTLMSDAINCEFIIGNVVRENGDLLLTLLLPISMRTSEAARFPEAIIDPADGPIALPR